MSFLARLGVLFFGVSFVDIECAAIVRKAKRLRQTADLLADLRDRKEREAEKLQTQAQYARIARLRSLNVADRLDNLVA